MEVPGLTARDLDVEIIQKDGTNTISVSGIPNINRRDRAVVNSRFSQSFEINDDEIDVEGIHANISSGVLTIMLPRKKQDERKKNSDPSVLNDGSIDDTYNGDKIPIFDSKREIYYWADPDENLGKSSNNESKNKNKNDQQRPQEEDDFFISEEEDIWP